MNRKRASSVAFISRSKKIKLESQDPFHRIPVELHELFLQNLNANGVKNLSEVSTSCYASTAASKSCMQKIRLAVCERYLETRTKTLSQEDVESILDTTRKYSAVKLSLFLRGNYQRIFPFLNAISDSLEELELGRIRRFKDSLTRLHFPELKSLTLIGNDSTFNENVLHAIAHVPLQKLKLDSTLTDDIMNILRKAYSLKELIVSLSLKDPDYVSKALFLIDLNIEKLVVHHVELK